MNKGYTAIEFIMVIAVIGFFAAIALPAFVISYNTLKLEGAYRQLRQDIRYAQQLAIARQVTHGVSFDPSAEAYFVYRQSTSNIVKDPAAQKPLSITYATGKFSGVNLVSTTFTNNRLEFDSLGRPSQGGTVGLAYGTLSKTISVEANTGITQ